ncbi:MAG: metallophosphoesterase, partial [Chloroflexi bacterium]|nr:metallophosphoesterase [Chloroflexota bacterium]
MRFQRLRLSAATVALSLVSLLGASPTGAADDGPAAPTNLAGTAAAGQVSLTWSASPGGPVAGYNVYRDSTMSGPSAVMVGAGDIAGCGSLGDEATALLLDAVAGTVVALGDNAYEDGSAADFANCYEPSWGRHKARTRPAVGNHEYHSPNASPYFDYFGSAAGEVGKGYYSYELGTWHVVVLNSNCWIVSCAAGSAQEQWLRADLAASPAQCTVAYWHHPRFSSGAEHGSDASVDPFWTALYEANADVVLNGHDHIYERFGPQTPAAAADPIRGIRQFNVGTGGKSQYNVGVIKDNSEVRETRTFGVLRLDLRPGAFDWRFLSEAGSTFTDNGSGACHDANGSVARTGPLNGTPLTTPEYIDASVVPGTEYHYVVTAVDSAGRESPPSALATVTVGASLPPTFARDTFGRTVINGFGSTSPGGSYSLSG